MQFLTNTLISSMEEMTASLRSIIIPFGSIMLGIWLGDKVRQFIEKRFDPTFAPWFQVGIIAIGVAGAVVYLASQGIRIYPILYF